MLLFLYTDILADINQNCNYTWLFFKVLQVFKVSLKNTDLEDKNIN